MGCNIQYFFNFPVKSLPHGNAGCRAATKVVQKQPAAALVGKIWALPFAWTRIRSSVLDQFAIFGVSYPF
ncbi:hypothetical protein NE619_06880 [Anaerovorax odorimutans]|uniref:Uncharacterized protein n=1 Tax=Anaerovorax odorimutans TaxID=109327 RepID=A0ABT1RMP8_9FIRM|nr:hypothetical protein [Anaerovorax odorimutans]